MLAHPPARSLIGKFAHDLERRKTAFLALSSVLFLAMACAWSHGKLLWYDEISTLYFTRPPTLRQVLALIYSGQDLNPPLFHTLTHFSVKIFGENAFALRLPEMLGFWLMCLCLFRFVERRTSAVHGAIAMLFPVLTRAFDYAYEGRPYGLLLGFGTLGLLFWQRATEGGRRAGALAGLVLSLAAAISTHYYAVLFYLPLAVGELVRLARSRRPDWTLWACTGVSLLPLAIFVPMMRTAHSGAASYWAKPQWRSVIEFYGYLLNPLIVPAVLLLFALGLLWKYDGATAGEAKTRGPHTYELAAAAALAATPLWAMMLAKFYTGAYTERYALASVAGLALLAGFVPAIYEDARRRTAAAAAFILYTSFFAVGLLTLPKLALEPDSPMPGLALPGGSEMPVAVTDGRIFVQMAKYCRPELRRRLVYISDPEFSLRATRSNVVDFGVESLSHMDALNVVRYGEFMRAHNRFLVYGPYGSAFDWLCGRLVHEGIRVEVKGAYGPFTLYEAVVRP